MIQLPQLQESLLIANERLVDRARRRARLFRTGMMTSAAVISIGGAAAAGTALWGPVLGHEDGNRPTASSTPVPAAQAALLGVLRRDQTSDDRGAAARQALALAAKRYAGVRLDDVRLLYSGASGAALVLVPVVRVGSQTVLPAGQTKDALCVFAQDGTVDSSLSCFSTAEVRAGAATGTVSGLSWGIVPDGVARVVAHGRDGADLELDVQDNSFTAPATDLDPKALDVAWFDGSGQQITPPDGSMRLRLPVVRIGSRVAPGFHDCGPADGNAVPVSVPCGPASRAWKPSRAQDNTIPGKP